MIKGSCLCGGVKFEIDEARSLRWTPIVGQPEPLVKRNFPLRLISRD